MATCVPSDRNVSSILRRQHDKQSIEELKHLVRCKTLELERARAEAEAQNEVQEARRLKLQELFTTASSERDEAREQLLKLTQRLKEYSTKHHIMSSDDSLWPDTMPISEPDEVKPSAAAATAMHLISSPLDGLADQFSWNLAGHNLGHLELRSAPQMHQSLTQFTKIHCSNLTELQDQPFYHDKEQGLSLAERQESEQQHQVESYLPHVFQDKSTDHDLSVPQQEAGATANGRRELSNPFLGVAEHGHMTCQNPQSDLVFPFPSIDHSTQAAMMDPLPQRRHPTRPQNTVHTVQIPKISTSPSNSLFRAPMALHMPNSHSPTYALDPLQVKLPLSSSHPSISPPTGIDKTPIADAFITPLQSGSAAASSSSQLLRSPPFDSQRKWIPMPCPPYHDSQGS